MKALLILILLCSVSMAQYGKSVIVGDKGRTFDQDRTTDAMVGISYPHHKLHEGWSFNFVALDGDLDAADTLGFLIVTPNTARWAHLVFEIKGQLDTEIRLFRGSTHTVADTQTVFNLDENSANTNTTLIKGVTRVQGNDGTLIYTNQFGIDAGTGALRLTSGGGLVRGERIMGQNISYYICVISNSANNKVSIELNWYEHINK